MQTTKEAVIGRRDLMEFRDLKREIAAQTRRADELERRVREYERGVWVFGSQRRKRPQAAPDSVIQAKIGMEVSIIMNLEKLEKRAAEIENAVQRVESPLHRELLRLRYIDGLEWEAVAGRVGYVTRQCLRHHRAALEMLEHTQSVAGGET